MKQRKHITVRRKERWGGDRKQREKESKAYDSILTFGELNV